MALHYKNIFYILFLHIVFGLSVFYVYIVAVYAVEYVIFSFDFIDWSWNNFVYVC